jgi:hypothetical protein
MHHVTSSTSSEYEQTKRRWRWINLSCGGITLCWTVLALIVWYSIPKSAFQVPQAWPWSHLRTHTWASDVAA